MITILKCWKRGNSNLWKKIWIIYTYVLHHLSHLLTVGICRSFALHWQNLCHDSWLLHSCSSNQNFTVTFWPLGVLLVHLSLSRKSPYAGLISHGDWCEKVTCSDMMICCSSTLFFFWLSYLLMLSVLSQMGEGISPMRSHINYSSKSKNCELENKP